VSLEDNKYPSHWMLLSDEDKFFPSGCIKATFGLNVPPFFDCPVGVVPSFFGRCNKRQDTCLIAEGISIHNTEVVKAGFKLGSVLLVGVFLLCSLLF